MWSGLVLESISFPRVDGKDDDGRRDQKKGQRSCFCTDHPQGLGASSATNSDGKTGVGGGSGAHRMRWLVEQAVGPRG